MPTPRTERIEARTTPDTLAIVRQAAEIQGRSVSDFVVSAAEHAARQAIADDQTLRLSAADQRQFIEAMLASTQPNAAMLRAIDHYKRLIG
jgi:uncharacterized protein (DUF1778 family)